MKKLLIVGKTGLVSKGISSKMPYEIKYLSRENGFDLENIKDFDFNILDQFDCILYTVAISSPDICTKDFDYANNINVICTKYFIKQALSKNKKIIFLSSDAVYGEDLGYAFCENDFATPFSDYGKMKLEIEQAFKSQINFKSIRLSYVLDINDKYSSYCIDCIQNNKEIEIFHPIYRNVISTNEIARLLQHIIENFDNISMPFINAAGKHCVSRIQIFDEINRYFKKDALYKIVKPSDDFYKIRPKITEMKSILKLDIFKDTFSERMHEYLENSDV